MADRRPIGIFDSGLGGLTVVKSVLNHLPHESIIYFGDTARVPYGNKSPELIREYSIEIADYLVKRNAKMIIVACNTATALALEALKEHINVPVIGVIEPGATQAYTATKNKNIGIIGTLATVSSKAYEKALKSIDKNVHTLAKACPLFVPLAEEGWLDGGVTEAIAEHYLQPLQNSAIDTLILGCTHYPLLKKVIATKVNSHTVLIDSADAVAVTVQKQLTINNQLSDSSVKGTLNCYVTDIPMHFEDIGQRFLGSKIDHVHLVHDL